jgi:hypothetical protein
MARLRTDVYTGAQIDRPGLDKAQALTDRRAIDAVIVLPTQLEVCERYAHDTGFEVIGTFKDDCTGAAPLETRPEGCKRAERSGI